MKKFKVGDQVELLSGGVPGFGGLNRFFLAEEGYHGGLVLIVQVHPDGSATVKLPSGYMLNVTRSDVKA